MNPALVRATALVALLGSVVLVLHALLLGFSIEPTDAARDRAATGEQIAFFAIPGAIVAVAALLGTRHRWGIAAAVLALLLAGIALAIDVAG